MICVLAEQGHGEERAVSEPDEGIPDAALVGPGLGDVGDLDRLAHLGRAPHEPFALPEGHRPEGLDQVGVSSLWVARSSNCSAASSYS